MSTALVRKPCQDPLWLFRKRWTRGSVAVLSVERLGSRTQPAPPEKVTTRAKVCIQGTPHKSRNSSASIIILLFSFVF